MNEEELKRKIGKVLGTVSQKLKRQIRFIECLFEFRQKQKDATYLAVIERLYPEDYRQYKARGELALLALEKHRKGTVQKLRNKIDKKILASDSDLFFSFFIELHNKKFCIVTDPKLVCEKREQDLRRKKNSQCQLDKLHERYNRLDREKEERTLKGEVIEYLEDIEREFSHMMFSGSIEKYIPVKVVQKRKGVWSVDGKLRYAQLVSWEEINQKKLVVVLADAGMGKSTLLRREAWLLALEQKKILENNKENLDKVILPVFLELYKLEKENKEIFDAVPALISRDYPKSSIGLIRLLRDKVDSGKCLLLLDSLDRVPLDRRNELSDKLNLFAKYYPCRIICTSRIVGYPEGFLKGAKEVKIIPFKRNQIEKYVVTWFENAPEPVVDDLVSANAFLHELRRNPQALGLARSPLLLSLMCNLYQKKDLSLLSRRNQIYEKIVKYMLGEWSQKRKPSSEWRIISKTNLLAAIAYHFTSKGKEIFSAKRLKKFCEKYLEQTKESDFKGSTASELLSELSEDDGIIRKLESKGNSYLFLHRTFQEYLAALHLKQAIEEDQSCSIKLVKELIGNYEWHESMALVAGMLEDPISLIQDILRVSVKDDGFNSRLKLAGRCVAECEKLRHPLITRIIERVYELWHSCPSSDFVNSLVLSIALVHPQMCQKLIRALEDVNIDIRWLAARALGEIGGDQAIEALIRTLYDQAERVRWQAAFKLGEIGGDRAIEALIRAFNAQDERDRWHVVIALGEIGGDRAIEALIRALNDQGERVRLQAAIALGKIGGDRAIEALIRALYDQDKLVRWQAAFRLGKIGGDRAIEALIRAFNVQDKRDRWHVVIALGEIGGDRAIEALIRALNDQGELVRWHAAFTLGEIGGDRAIEGLIGALNDQAERVRWQAAFKLGEVGGDRAIKGLIRALNDQNEHV